MTSLTTAVGGMKHWDWCPICRGGLDTGLECDQCGADLMPIYTAFKESLSGGNPGEPKACTPAEERGIVGATGAGQLPATTAETRDSAERRSPDGTERTPSLDESNQHLVKMRTLLSSAARIITLATDVKPISEWQRDLQRRAETWIKDYYEEVNRA